MAHLLTTRNSTSSLITIHNCISIKKRRDFLDPDFNVRGSLKLANNKKRSKCRLKGEADSEIPELGLDSGRLNIDCQLNPARIADSAIRVARTYSKHRRDRQRKRAQLPQRSGSVVKRKRTRINIDSDYEKSKNVNTDDNDEDNDNDNEED